MGRADEFCANAEPNKAATLNSLNISLTDGSKPSVQVHDQAAPSSLTTTTADVNGTSVSIVSTGEHGIPATREGPAQEAVFLHRAIGLISQPSLPSAPSITPTEGLSLRGCVQLLVHTGTKVPDSSPLVPSTIKNIRAYHVYVTSAKPRRCGSVRFVRCGPRRWIEAGSRDYSEYTKKNAGVRKY